MTDEKKDKDAETKPAEPAIGDLTWPEALAEGLKRGVAEEYRQKHGVWPPGYTPPGDKK